MKKLLALILAATMLLGCAVTAQAADPRKAEAAAVLYDLGLFQGTGTNADGTPDGGSFLEFSCAECVQCGLCVDACMKKCITVSPQVRTAELFDFEPRFIYLPKPQARPGILSRIKR